jgi:hypothetical protein
MQAAMLDLRTLDPARQTADRRVVVAFGYGALGAVVFFALVAGASVALLVVAAVLALAGIPWVFAFNGRARLFDDALRGVPFAWRGDRAGVWATAPTTGALLTLLVVSRWPSALATLACLVGAVAYSALIAWVEQRYERAILLDLTVLETRFKRITRVSPPPPEPRLIAASRLKVK